MNVHDLLTEQERKRLDESLKPLLAEIDTNEAKQLREVSERSAELRLLAQREVLVAILGIGAVSSPAPVAPASSPSPAAPASAPQAVAGSTPKAPKQDALKSPAKATKASKATGTSKASGIPKGFLSTKEFYGRCDVAASTLSGYMKQGIITAAGTYLSRGRESYYWHPNQVAELKKSIHARSVSTASATASQPTDDPSLITSAEAARRLGVTTSALSKAVYVGTLTTHIRGGGGRMAIFKAEEIERYAKARVENRARAAQALNKTPKEETEAKEETTTEKTEAKEETLGAEDEEPLAELSPLENPRKIPYHWRNALPVLEAGIEQAEKDESDSLEIAYQPGAGEFVTRPFGQAGAGLLAFARVNKGQRNPSQGQHLWSVTVPLSVESWIRPMAEALKAHCQRHGLGKSQG